jgi:hypothetical protein
MCALLRSNINLTESDMEKEAGLTFLRIKIKHLALEPALVKLEERRKRAKAHYKALKASKAGNTPAYEDPWLAVEMRVHRLAVIRPEARAAQLAYAFLRGKSYASVEPTSKYAPPIQRVAELIVKYGAHTDKGLAMESLIPWIEASGRWQWKKAGWFECVKEQKAAA